MLIGGEDARRVRLPIIHGRAPTTFGEVALGADTAAELGAKVGDHLDVAFGRRRNSCGSASASSARGLPRSSQTSPTAPGSARPVHRRAPQSDLLEPERRRHRLHVRRHHPEARARHGRSRRACLTPWDLPADPFVYSAQIRPPEIRNAESIRNGPVLLAAVLGVALLIALGLAIAVSVNERKRDLAVLRAMGFTRAQLRRSVLAQALTTVLIGIVIGLPLGIVAGRWSWGVFADELGIAPDATVPIRSLAAMAAVVALGAIVAAARPASVARAANPPTSSTRSSYRCFRSCPAHRQADALGRVRR